jgi:S1-C subfamily serine protease
MIIKNILEVVAAANNKPKLAFLTTREQQTSTSARFTVSLGIMPDYTYSGTGVRVDGVSEGRVAQKAGMKAGDIIVQLGEHNTTSVETYMQALSKFKKGDATTVKYKRGNDVVEVQVQFQ